MRILFLSHYFPPEVNAPALRTHEHCREWARAGHDVHVITCVPSHPRGKPFPGHRMAWYQREQIDGITVHRVWTLLAPNEGVGKRSLNYLSFVPTAVWRALRLGRFDILIGTSPQVFCAMAAWLAALIKGVPWIFELRDIWPESISAVGAARRYMPLGLLERLELRMYAAADHIVCVSEAFIRNLTSRGVEAAKLSFVPNGVDAFVWRQGSPEKGRAALGVGPDDVVVSFVGTVGMAHDLGTILEVAGRMRTARPDVRFVIVGDGAELPALRERARTAGLTNVTFTGLVSRDKTPHCLAATDISLVTLKRSEAFKSVLPSKMFESMAAGKPIVLAVEGEAARLLARAGAGVATPPGDAAAMYDSLLGLVSDPARRRALGDAGARFVEQEFARSLWAQRYLHILEHTSVYQTVPAGSAEVSSVS